MDMTKSAFAEHIGVTPGRVSQMLSTGIIGADALVGEGRNARINVELAKHQISERRHQGQALGNGLTTRLGDEAPDGPANAPAADLRTKPVSVTEQIQQERLEQERRKNRQAAIDEAKESGALVTGEDFRRELGRMGQAMISEFVGAAPDIANAIAAQFKLPQRDVLHLVKQVMTERRRTAAQRMRDHAGTLPESAETEIEVE